MTNGAAPVFIFLACLGISILLVIEVSHRIRQAKFRRRREAIFAAHKDLYRRSISASPYERMDWIWESVGDIWFSAPAWPREKGVRRLIIIGILSSFALIFILKVALHLPTLPSIFGGILLGFILPRILDDEAQNRQTDKFVELLPDAVDMLVRMLRAGLPLQAAVARVGEEASIPAGPIFIEVAEWLDVGVPLGDAFLLVNARIKQDDFEFFGVSLAVQNMSGGNLTDTLESLSSIIRERILANLKAKSISAEARMTANVISALPVLLIVGIQLVQPDYLEPLVDGTHGYGMITYAIGSFAIGIWTIRNMINRLLTS